MLISTLRLFYIERHPKLCYSIFHPKNIIINDLVLNLSEKINMLVQKPFEMAKLEIDGIYRIAEKRGSTK